MTLAFKTQVVTPDGLPGRIDGRYVDGDEGMPKVLVSHARNDFSPEVWSTLSPKNGPSIFRVYKVEDLKIVIDPFPTKNDFKPKAASMAKVIEDFESTVKKSPKKMDKPVAAINRSEAKLDAVKMGDHFSTNRNGDRYEVIGIHPDTGVITLSWLAGKYKRDVKRDSLLSHYTAVEKASNG